MKLVSFWRLQVHSFTLFVKNRYSWSTISTCNCTLP